MSAPVKSLVYSAKKSKDMFLARGDFLNTALKILFLAPKFGNGI
jgi:hypothetical protein